MASSGVGTAGSSVQAGEEGGPIGFEWTELCSPEDQEQLLPDHAGCRCAGGSCSRGACPCASSNLTSDDKGRLLVLPALEAAEMELTECGANCSCFGACGCGFSSRAGAAVRGGGGGGGQPDTAAVGAPAVQPYCSLQQLPGKGWGVFADEPLPAGLLVCHYAGEYLTSTCAQQRLAEYDAARQGHALLVRLAGGFTTAPCMLCSVRLHTYVPTYRMHCMQASN